MEDEDDQLGLKILTAELRGIFDPSFIYIMLVFPAANYGGKASGILQVKPQVHEVCSFMDMDGLESQFL